MFNILLTRAGYTLSTIMFILPGHTRMGVCVREGVRWSASISVTYSMMYFKNYRKTARTLRDTRETGIHRGKISSSGPRENLD